jgi:hypothetical protein
MCVSARRIVTKPLLQRSALCPYRGRNERNREGVPMSGQQQEVAQQHMLCIVEAAQRAGCSESEIAELVDAVVEADADLERAA